MNSTTIQASRRISDATQFVFRELRTVSEQRQSLALRYQVYSQTLGLPQLSSLDHSTGLDLDAHDLASHHFGLFARDESGESVVGTLRITGTRSGPMAPALHEIASARPSLAARLTGAPPAPLPMLTYLKQAAAVREVYDRLAARGEEIAEPGRLTIHPALRVAAARAGLKLSHFLIVCAEAVAWHLLELDRVLMDCDTRLEPFYRRFGFFPVPGGEPAYQPELDISFTVLQATPDSLPVGLRSEVAELAREQRWNGEAMMGNTGANHSTVRQAIRNDLAWQRLRPPAA